MPLFGRRLVAPLGRCPNQPGVQFSGLADGQHDDVVFRRHAQRQSASTSRDVRGRVRDSLDLSGVILAATLKYPEVAVVVPLLRSERDDLGVEVFGLGTDGGGNRQEREQRGRRKNKRTNHDRLIVGTPVQARDRKMTI